MLSLRFRKDVKNGGEQRAADLPLSFVGQPGYRNHATIAISLQTQTPGDNAHNYIVPTLHLVSTSSNPACPCSIGTLSVLPMQACSPLGESVPLLFAYACYNASGTRSRLYMASRPHPKGSGHQILCRLTRCPRAMKSQLLNEALGHMPESNAQRTM